MFFYGTCQDFYLLHINYAKRKLGNRKAAARREREKNGTKQNSIY